MKRKIMTILAAAISGPPTESIGTKLLGSVRANLPLSAKGVLGIAYKCAYSFTHVAQQHKLWRGAAILDRLVYVKS